MSENTLSNDLIREKILKLNELGVQVVYKSVDEGKMTHQNSSKITDQHKTRCINQVKFNANMKNDLIKMKLDPNQVKLDVKAVDQVQIKAYDLSQMKLDQLQYKQFEQNQIKILDQPQVKAYYNQNKLQQDSNQNQLFDQGIRSNDLSQIKFNKSQIIFSSSDSNDTINKEFILKQGFNISVGYRPIDYFTLMANGNFLKQLLEETNTNLNDIQDGTEFTEKTTMTEIVKFIGLLFHMGTIQLNRIVDYWSSDPLFNFTCISNHMTRNRFMILLKCIQHSDLIQHFNNVMFKCYTAGRILTIKEPLYYVDGKFKKKASSDSSSINCVSEPNGVVLKICVAEKITETVVSDLLGELVSFNRCVYVDQIYSSVKLAHKLLENSTFCTGLLPNDTLRLANMMQDKPLIGIIQKGVLIGRWKKDCSVFFSSEFTEIENIEIDSPPKALSEFNNYMSNDKLNDELLSYYSCERRQMSFDKKILIHVLQVMLMNAYYLYNQENEVKTTLYDFRLDVIRELIDPSLSQVCGEQHSPTLVELDAQGKQKKMKCRVCFRRNGIQQKTAYYCPKCPDLPGLCKDECFKLHHTSYNIFS